MIAAILDTRQTVEALWRKAEAQMPILLARAEALFLRLVAREPGEPETLIATRFETVEGATFSARRFGFVVIAIFFGIGGLWATLAPLSSAAIAPGVVSPKSSRQTVQHLEGGIIKEILIHEGDAVQAGQKLFLLEDVGARAEVDSLTNRLNKLNATEARLIAERDGAADIAFGPDLLNQLSDPEIRQIIDAQVNQFNTRHANDESRKAILRQRIAELEQQITGLEEQLASAIRQSVLIEEESGGVQTLVDKGLERKPRLLALERNRADLLGRQGELKARIAQAREAIGEAQLEIMKTDIERNENVDAELAETQAKKIETAQLLKERRDRLARTEIAAPVAGTVLDIRFKTPGGVIKPGEDVVDLVPTNDTLVIDAKVSPKDIDQVRAGLEATVAFPAYTQRILPRLEGRVAQVSADALMDQRSGERYYTARVEVDREKIHKAAPSIELQPGMSSEVFITTGERTLLEYLVGPFFNVLRRSFRES